MPSRRTMRASVAIEPTFSEHPRQHSPALWESIDALIDRVPTLEELREHRLQFIAANRWLRAGRAIPPSLAAELTLAAALDLPVRNLLARVGAAWGGQMAVLKGSEVASRYPAGALRPARDIDLLVDDPAAAHAALRDAGFVPAGDPRQYVDIHHLQPLRWPSLPVAIELHHTPKWIDGLQPPATAELLELAVPARGDAEGFLTLAPAAHAVVLAVHSWAHEPLNRIGDLVDVALLAAEADVREMDRLARSWGVSRVWKTTYGTVEALFFGGPRPFALRLWARHLQAGRARTVAESHLAEWLSGYWALPAPTAFRRNLQRIGEVSRPVPGETWGTKLARARLAARNAGAPRSAHERRLEEVGLATPSALLLDRLEQRRERQTRKRNRAQSGPSESGPR